MSEQNKYEKAKESLTDAKVINEAEKKGKYIWVTKMGVKGQVVIPKEAREIFNLNAGDGLLLFGDIDRGIAIAKSDAYYEFAKAIIEANMPKEKWFVNI